MPATRAPGKSPEQKREERKHRALTNAAYFAEAYFAPYDPNWTELMPAFGVDMLRFCVAARPWPYKAGVIILPPEFMKTTLVSQSYALWLTLRARIHNKLLRGLLLSEEETMAAGNLSVIKWHILNNERLATDFADEGGRPLLAPDPDADKWAETSIICARPGMISRDPTWQAKGLDSKGIQGRRLDVVIGDDVVTPKNADSPALRKSALRVMDFTVETRVVEGGQILVAGNFNDPKDLLSALEARRRYRVFKRPSLHRPEDPALAPRESELFHAERSIETWPENWSKQRLKIEYEEKPNRFRRIHLLDPRAEQGDRLQVGWMQKLSDEDGLALLKYAKFYLGVDPAPGGSDEEDLDFFNVTVLALTQNHIDLVQTVNVRASTPHQVDLLGSLHDTYQRVGYGVSQIGGAKQAMDRYFRGSIEIKRPDLKPKLYEVSIPEAEAAKEVRLEGLGPRAQSGWLRCWQSAWEAITSDEIDQHQELSLMEEWREFPYGNHDDRLDGLDIGIRTAMDDSLLGGVEFTMKVAEA